MEFRDVVALAVIVIGLLWFKDSLQEDTEVSAWLEERDKSHLASTLYKEGIYTLHELARINFLQTSTFDRQERNEINEVSKLAKQWLELMAWLERRGLLDVSPVLKENGVASLDVMRGWSEARWDVIRESQNSVTVKLKVKKLGDILRSEEQITVSDADDGGVVWSLVNVVWRIVT
ncbi:uncharacterized protein LOC134197933, partial [Corticium candelabrum]|uniref:uncharacterized protein LOC134197933 n=1 Tax=Corticium candelabrum TaxID=121492 RepID=UPI002E271366